MHVSRVTDLGCKEVINICDGTRYGYIKDLEIDISSGQVVSIIVPGMHKFLWFSFKKDEYTIPWSCIKRIGEDIILVDYQLTNAPKREKRTWF